MKLVWQRALLGGLALTMHAVSASSVHAQLSDDPWTIAPGRTQIETDVYGTIDRDAGVRSTALSVASILISHGLTERADIQLGFDGYYRDRTHAAGGTTTTDDWGDLTLRAKYSLWGHLDDEFTAGDTACALLPYVKLPLRLGDGGSDLVEGGLILPLALGLPAALTVVVMTQLSAVADSGDRGHEFEWIESIVLSRPFSEKTSGYLEFYSIVPAESGRDWLAQCNVGLYYAFTPEFCLDVGCNFGVTRATADLEPFVGLTYLY